MDAQHGRLVPRPILAAGPSGQPLEGPDEPVDADDTAGVTYGEVGPEGLCMSIEETRQLSFLYILV